jgi:hypothetical protein
LERANAQPVNRFFSVRRVCGGTLRPCISRTFEFAFQIETDHRSKSKREAADSEENCLCARAANYRVKSGGHDSTKGKCTEEALAAGTTPIGGETQPALYADECSPFDPVPRDEFQVKISALGTMGVACEGDRHAPGIKAVIACMASPGPQTRERGDEIKSSLAV